MSSNGGGSLLIDVTHTTNFPGISDGTSFFGRLSIFSNMASFILNWSSGQDSNLQPSDYESPALTDWATGGFELYGFNYAVSAIFAAKPAIFRFRPDMNFDFRIGVRRLNLDHRILHAHFQPEDASLAERTLSCAEIL